MVLALHAAHLAVMNPKEPNKNAHVRNNEMSSAHLDPIIIAISLATIYCTDETMQSARENGVYCHHLERYSENLPIHSTCRWCDYGLDSLRCLPIANMPLNIRLCAGTVCEALFTSTVRHNLLLVHFPNRLSIDVAVHAVTVIQFHCGRIGAGHLSSAALSLGPCSLHSQLCFAWIARRSTFLLYGYALFVTGGYCALVIRHNG